MTTPLRHMITTPGAARPYGEGGIPTTPADVPPVESTP